MLTLLPLLGLLLPLARAQAVTAEVKVDETPLHEPMVALPGGGLAFLTRSTLYGPLTLQAFDPQLQSKWSLELDFLRPKIPYGVGVLKAAPVTMPFLTLPIPAIIPKLAPFAPGAGDLGWSRVAGELRVFHWDQRGLVAHRIDVSTGDEVVQVLAETTKSATRFGVLVSPDGQTVAGLGTARRSGAMEVRIFGADLAQKGSYTLTVPTDRRGAWTEDLYELDLDNQGRLIATWRDNPESLRVERYDLQGSATRTLIPLIGDLVMDSITQVDTKGTIAVSVALPDKGLNLDRLLFAVVGEAGLVSVNRSAVRELLGSADELELERMKLVGLDPAPGGGWLVSLRPYWQDVATPSSVQQGASATKVIDEFGDLQLLAYSETGALRWVREVDMDQEETVGTGNSLVVVNPAVSSNYALFSDKDTLQLVYHDIDDSRRVVVAGDVALHSTLLRSSDGAVLAERVLPVDTRAGVPLAQHLNRSADGDLQMLITSRAGRTKLLRVEMDAVPSAREDTRRPTERKGR